MCSLPEPMPKALQAFVLAGDRHSPDEARELCQVLHAKQEKNVQGLTGSSKQELQPELWAQQATAEPASSGQLQGLLPGAGQAHRRNSEDCNMVLTLGERYRHWRLQTGAMCGSMGAEIEM